MTAPDSPVHAPLVQHFRQHFGHRDHLSGLLLAQMADDLEAGGVVWRICRDKLSAPRSEAVQLRLLAAVFRIVLRGDAPQLTPFYESLGGNADKSGCWAVMRPVLVAHQEELREGLKLPPQTNEPGRSACLALGLFEAVRRSGMRRVRLLEPGASAGLNLLVDHYRVTGAGWSSGASDSPLLLDTGLAAIEPEPYEIVARRGCDLAPVDASTPDGARYLTSFVWPFDLARHARLAAALEVAKRHPVDIDRESASAWLHRQLSEPASADTLTVVWQSITQQYWRAEETAAVREVVRLSRSRMAVSHVTLEGVPPASGGDGSYTIATHGARLEVDGQVIARSHHHGLPVVLSDS